MLLLIPWMRFCLDTRLVLSHELVSREMQEASLLYPTLTPPEKKKAKKREIEREKEDVTQNDDLNCGNTNFK